MARSYAKEGANTGKKCIGRILVKYSLWALGGLALTSAAFLIKENIITESSSFLGKILGK